jgi:hypothetical protein
MLTPALRRGIRHPASISAQATTSGGVRTTPEHLFDLNISPIDSVDPDILIRFALLTPFQAKQAFAYVNQEIKPGMYLVVGDKQYPIKGTATYPDDDGYTLYHMILEDVLSK